MKETSPISIEQLAQMIDVSAVRADSSWEDVLDVAKLARERNCIAVFSLSGFTRQLAELLLDVPKIRIGGTVGFPSGGETTASKVFQAMENLTFGCSEIDMVMNIGAMLSGQHDVVESDIAAVKQAIGSVPLKVILECHYLNSDQIRIASQRAVRAGASWVKTGTGWAASGTTFEQVKLIKETVGDRARVKAAGGVRDLNTLLEMHRLGAERFGIGFKTAKAIFEEYERRFL